MANAGLPLENFFVMCSPAKAEIRAEVCRGSNYRIHPTAFGRG
jgi:hypothetical protein